MNPHGPHAQDGRDWFAQPVRDLSPLDREHGADIMRDLAEGARSRNLPRLAALAASHAPLARFLAAVFDLSPFMQHAARRRPQMLECLFDQPLAERIEALIGQIDAMAVDHPAGEAELMARLRQLKGEIHFLIALGQLAGASDTALTTARLSDLADACIRAAAAFLLQDAHRQGKIRLADPARPWEGCGWIILAMGKLGARELNFSSDIDLIAFVDPEAPAILDPADASEVYSRLTRRLVRILQERTEHGYVFRTDLRLRPDPGSTPPAIPVEAALIYYESRGQNWERAAMIKARTVAGDEAAGVHLLGELQPFVWRRYLDYAAISDIHSIKRQIHAHKGHGAITVRGHNVKLGRGGIREIEFFVQTQQLIAGGRFAQLRGRRTVAMLSALAAQGWISEEAREALTRQYWFLRDVEHAIQMVEDEQSHTLPQDEAGLERIARLLAFQSERAFADAFQASLLSVEAHYAALFEAAPQLSSGVGNLVFTGEVDDPDTLETLRQLGFERASDVSRVVRSWHSGRYRATRSSEARARLTELAPVLLATFGRTRRADEAIMRFDSFLAGLPAGIQLFSLLQSNPDLLNLLATIMGAAPRLAAVITRRAHVFDGLLDPALLSELPNKAYLTDRLDSFVSAADGYEERLDRLRIFASEQRFLIGIRLLTGTIDARRAGKAFSDLADLTIAAALDAVTRQLAERHGAVAGGRVAIVGMGKLGSRELTAGSDVDLILLYDHDPRAEASDGDRPLAPSHYYARLTQRLIAALSAPTAEGVLYEIDLRLRPSGNKGPVATHIDAFRTYQRRDAETWEHMALTRARTIAGEPEFCRFVDREIASVLALERDGARTARAAWRMRELIENEKPARDLWDLKLIPGGLIDLEFIAQVAILAGQIEAEQRPVGTLDTLACLAPGFAGPSMRHELVDAHALYFTLSQSIRLCLTGPFDRADIPPGLADLMLRETDLPDLGVLEAHVRETAQRVRAHCKALLTKWGR